MMNCVIVLITIYIYVYIYIYIYIYIYKKLVKNEAENGQLLVKKLQKNLKFYKTFRSLDLLQLQKSR